MKCLANTFSSPNSSFSGESRSTASKAGVELHKSEVRLPDGVLRSVGDYQIEIQLHADVKTEITVSIVPEK